jgi:hypothetical protein
MANMLKKKMRGRRGGLGTLIAQLVLIALVVGGVVGVAFYYTSISSGATSQPNLIFADSIIKVDAATKAGTIYIKIYNQGPGGVRVQNITITDKTGTQFTLSWKTGSLVVTKGTGSVSGSPGVGAAGTNPNGFLSIPAGASASIMVTITGAQDITANFDPATVYAGVVEPIQAAKKLFTIPSSGNP